MGEVALLLRHSEEGEEMQKRLTKAKSTLPERGVVVEEVWQEGGLIQSLLNRCLRLDMVPIYTAVIRAIGPVGTPFVDELRST